MNIVDIYIIVNNITIMSFVENENKIHPLDIVFTKPRSANSFDVARINARVHYVCH